MHNLKRWMILVTFIAVLAGCQTADTTLPTQIDLGATNEALTIIQTGTASVPTQTPFPTATSLRPTLPPTFTSTPDLPPTETPIPTLDSLISPTPEGFNKDGTIYYNYNGDSIARIMPDGSLNEIILTFGVDVPITDLTVSPNGQLLAFVAPAGGSAREVWVTNRDGSYRQQVSCLGYGEVRTPSFAPDNNRIAFFAAPLATTNMSLYVADFAGSNDCPTGNNQRELFPLSTTHTGNIAWNSSTDLIYFNSLGTFVYDFASGTTHIVTSETGFGTDFALSYNYETDRLAYLRRIRNISTGEQGGSLVVLKDADTLKPNYNLAGLEFYALSLQWSSDNESLVYATDDELVLYDTNTSQRYSLVDRLPGPQLVSVAPDTENFVYTANDPETHVMQLYKSNRRQSGAQQLTFNPEGTINSVFWLEG